MNSLSFNRQRGVVLVVALLMLLLVTLMVVSGFNLTQTNLKVVYNMESRTLAKQAAVRALEEAMSSNLFITGNAFPVSCDLPNRICYDFNGDAVDDVAVQIALSCSVVRVLSNDEVSSRAGGSSTPIVELGPDDDDSLPMLEDGPWTTCLKRPLNGVFEPDPDELSQCADVVWDMLATATDLQTGAQVLVRQGVATPTDINLANNVCD
jgi:hypothetical protein